MKIFAWILLVLTSINLVILSYAYREFGFLLTLQFLFTAVGLPLSVYLLMKLNLKHWFVATDDDGKLTHVYRDADDGLDVAGRFG